MKYQDFSFYKTIIHVSLWHIVKILFLSFTYEDIGTAMVTNMISQLQESFLLQFLYLRYFFAVTEFFSPSLEFWLFGTENISIIVFIPPLLL